MVSRSSVSRKSTSPIGGLAEAAHVAVIEARFYTRIADAMVAGAAAALERAGATYERLAVPGALELPSALCLTRQKVPVLSLPTLNPSFARDSLRPWTAKSPALPAAKFRSPT